MSVKETDVAVLDASDKEEQLHKIIAEHKKQAGALMPVLQQAQDLYGYLPVDVMETIAHGLKLSMAEVYGVVTFYSQFSMNPKGTYKVSVCLGTACYVKGSGDILDKISQKLGIGEGGMTEDGKFSLDACRCIGACGLAPVLTINEEVYGRLTSDDVADILAKYE